MVVVFMYPFATTIVGDIMASFLRTGVHCPLPQPDAAGHCPPGTVLRAGSCEPVPRGSAEWSLSAHCADKTHVVNAATELNGNVLMVNKVGILLGTAVLAPQMDSWGRKPMQLLSFGGFFLGGLMIFGSTFLGRSAERTGAVLFAALVCSVTNIFSTTCRAMVADQTTGDIAARTAGYAALQVAQGLGTMGALGACMYVLSLDLTDYRIVWLVYTLQCSALVAVVAITGRETLPRLLAKSCKATEGEPCRSETSSDAVSLESPSRVKEIVNTVFGMGVEMWRSLALVWHDPFLGHAISIAAVLRGVYAGMSASMTSYLLEVLEYSQVKTQIPGIVAPVVGLLGSALCPRLVRIVGTRWACAISIGLTGLGYGLVGLSSVFRGSGEALFWSGFVLLSTFSDVIKVCMLTLTTVRVDIHSQGKLEALSTLVMVSGGLLGTYLWSDEFFHANGTIFWTAAGSLFVALGWFVAACLLQRRRRASPEVQETSEDDNEEAEESPA